jgi:FKBP12-rapamycin complex-associated protein
MFDTLEPLHAMLERGPQTLKEISFTQAYGRDLTDALEWCHQYKVDFYRLELSDNPSY